LKNNAALFYSILYNSYLRDVQLHRVHLMAVLHTVRRWMILLKSLV